MVLSVRTKEGERDVAEMKNSTGLCYRLNCLTKGTTRLIGPPIARVGHLRRYERNNHTFASKIKFNTAALLILFLAVLLDLTLISDASPYIMNNCILNPQHAVDKDDASSCRYGFEVDACGTFFCTKGPSSYCGGKFERYGVCGEGLMCNKCNRCTGCSTKTFECWYDDNCIWSSD